jgi:bifunctional DNA-binding transcriptional regulator/antitoxin component of YhaV-PrlF toxin-antitoxin module
MTINILLIGGIIMTITTKVYKSNQTAIPSDIRKKFNVSPDDIVEWNINKDGKPELTFRKKTLLKDVLGLVKEDLPYNAVELKKMASKGQKIPRV